MRVGANVMDELEFIYPKVSLVLANQWIRVAVQGTRGRRGEEEGKQHESASFSDIIGASGSAGAR